MLPRPIWTQPFPHLSWGGGELKSKGGIMMSTRQKKGRWAGLSHGPLICFQLSCGTLTAHVRHVHAGSGGVKSLSFTVTDGFLSWVFLSFPLEIKSY